MGRARVVRDRYKARRVPVPDLYPAADQALMIMLLQWLGGFTYTPAQAEHLMVIVRGQTADLAPESAATQGER